jgi:hypothetical protein
MCGLWVGVPRFHFDIMFPCVFQLTLLVSSIQESQMAAIHQQSVLTYFYLHGYCVFGIYLHIIIEYSTIKFEK